MEYIIGKLLEDFEHGKMTRRQLIKTLALTTAAASTVGTAEAAAPKATYINHVSMQVADYTKTRDFYSGLFGMKVTDDNGKTQCRLEFGPNILIARTASSRPGGKAGVDHLAYSLENWDTDKVSGRRWKPSEGRVEDDSNDTVSKSPIRRHRVRWGKQ